jgi:hypothetical protein
MNVFSFLLPVLVLAEQQSGVKVLFQEKNDIFVAHDVVHLAIVFDLSPIEDQCMYFRQALKTVVPQFSSSIQLDDVWFSAAHLVKSTCDFQHIHTEPQHSIVKRQVFAAGLAAVVGTVFGLFSLVKINELARRVHSLEASHHDDLHLLHDYQTRMKLVERDIRAVNHTLTYLVHVADKQQDIMAKLFWMQCFLTQFAVVQSHVQIVNDGWAALLTQRFPVLWLLPQELPSVFQALVIRAQKMGGILPLQQDADLYHFPASFVVKDKKVVVFIHVPVVHERMKLYQYIGGPIARNNSEFVEIHGEFDHIIVSSKNRVHKEVDLNLLERSCVRMGQMLLCEHLGDLVRQLTATCLGSLYANEVPSIHDCCTVTEMKKTWSTVQLTSDQFQVFTRERTTLFTECHDGSRVSRVIHGLEDVHIPKACVVFTKEFELRPSSSSTMSVSIVHLIQLDHRRLETALERALIREAVPETHLEVGNGKEADVILAREDERERVHLTQQTLMWICVGLGISLVMIVVTFLVWLGWRYHGHRRAMPQDPVMTQTQ